MWITRDKLGYLLWKDKPELLDIRYARWSGGCNQQPPLHLGKSVDDIFVKLDGGELEVGQIMKVNLVEDDLY